jgi:hypothetical protein
MRAVKFETRAMLAGEAARAFSHQQINCLNPAQMHAACHVLYVKCDGMLPGCVDTVYAQPKKDR